MRPHLADWLNELRRHILYVGQPLDFTVDDTEATITARLHAEVERPLAQPV
jgi:hypothetical protein